MERILDLGCGTGDSWRTLRIAVENRQVIGIDLRQDRLQIARHKYESRGWRYRCARGEAIPLADGSVHGVFCAFSLPYMHIPRTLRELHRVLVPGGWLKASVHQPTFTLGELTQAFPKPRQSLVRLFVLFNGMLLHFWGRAISLGKVAESCQTGAGMQIALRRAGFTEVRFRHDEARFYVDARRDAARTAGLRTAIESVA
jgi:ubiquinone/menaquinone biosynthesis C-methylase UbiE